VSRYPEKIRPVWAEIDLAALTHNLTEVKRLVGPKVEIMAVVKAEAYGHGAVEVARTAIKAGATWLGVSLPEEGIALRQGGIQAPILVFQPLQSTQAAIFLDYNLTATVCLLDAAVALSREAVKRRLETPVAVHVKVDTGMGRVGIPYQDAGSFFKSLSVLPLIKATGIYSHLATADHQDKTFAKTQIERFDGVVKRLINAGVELEKIHLANSAGIIDLPDSYYNMVRPGIMLYGLMPSDCLENPNQVKLKPVFSLKTKAIFIKKVLQGTGISYGLRYQAQKDTTIVTIPIGYADGWSRILSNKVAVLIRGKRYPIVGTICMDQCMIDVDDEPIEIGQEITLIGSEGSQAITVDDVAQILGTINYEVTCMLGDRIPRVFLNKV